MTRDGDVRRRNGEGWDGKGDRDGVVRTEGCGGKAEKESFGGGKENVARGTKAVTHAPERITYLAKAVEEGTQVELWACCVATRFSYQMSPAPSKQGFVAGRKVPSSRTRNSRPWGHPSYLLEARNLRHANEFSVPKTPSNKGALLLGEARGNYRNYAHDLCSFLVMGCTKRPNSPGQIL